jgi:hypothetical protein
VSVWSLPYRRRLIQARRRFPRVWRSGLLLGRHQGPMHITPFRLVGSTELPNEQAAENVRHVGVRLAVSEHGPQCAEKKIFSSGSACSASKFGNAKLSANIIPRGQSLGIAEEGPGSHFRRGNGERVFFDYSGPNGASWERRRWPLT